jgi:hypothetical protein
MSIAATSIQLFGQLGRLASPTFPVSYASSVLGLLLLMLLRVNFFRCQLLSSS